MKTNHDYRNQRTDSFKKLIFRAIQSILILSILYHANTGHSKDVSRGSEHITTIYFSNSDSCFSGRTQTQGGWGSPAQGNNPGVYRDANFASAFPEGLKIGCDCHHHLLLTSAQAVRKFLPSGSGPRPLNADYTDPGKQYKNVLAGQLVALELSVGFDLYDPDFGSSSEELQFQRIKQGPFSGWTVERLLIEANRYIGGCHNDYSSSEWNQAITAINETFIGGIRQGNYVECDPENGASVGDQLWYDSNLNGILDQDEDGLSGVAVELWGSGPDGEWGSPDDLLINTDTSDQEGNYLFSGLMQGLYMVIPDANSFSDSFHVTSSSDSLEVFLSYNESLLNADFGYIKPGRISMQVSVETFTSQYGPFTYLYYNPLLNPDEQTHNWATYTYEVSNTGDAPIFSVYFLRDTCDATKVGTQYDNGDTLLQKGEVWFYECTRYWEPPFSGPIQVDPKVIGEDLLTHVTHDEGTALVYPLMLNMEISCNQDQVCPGDTVNIRLISRFYDYGMFANGHAQLDQLEFTSNIVPSWETGGPVSIYWADPGGDLVNVIPGASPIALDPFDSADAGDGSGAPDWIHELQYIVPESIQSQIIISAKDRSDFRLYDGFQWIEFPTLCHGADSFLLSLDCSQAMQIMIKSKPDEYNVFNRSAESEYGFDRDEHVWSVHPDPYQDRIRISSEGDMDNIQYLAFNLQGRLLASERTNKENTWLSIRQGSSNKIVLIARVSMEGIDSRIIYLD